MIFSEMPLDFLPKFPEIGFDPRDPFLRSWEDSGVNRHFDPFDPGKNKI